MQRQVSFKKTLCAITNAPQITQIQRQEIGFRCVIAKQGDFLQNYMGLILRPTCKEDVKAL